MKQPFDSDLNIDNLGFDQKRTFIGETPDQIEISEPITKAASPFQEKSMRVTLNANLKSFKLKEEKFSNHIKKVDSSKECNALRRIFLCTKSNELKVKEIPFCLNDETLHKNKRQRNILDVSGLSKSVLNNSIGKATYLDEVSRGFVNPKDGQPIRVYFVEKPKTDDSREIEIIIIDLYHLLATRNTKNYDSVKQYNTCMTKVFDNLSDDFQ